MFSYTKNPAFENSQSKTKSIRCKERRANLKCRCSAKEREANILIPVESIGVLFARSASSLPSGVRRNSGVRRGMKVLRPWCQRRKMGKFRDHTTQEK